MSIKLTIPQELAFDKMVLAFSEGIAVHGLHPTYALGAASVALARYKTRNIHGLKSEQIAELERLLNGIYDLIGKTIQDEPH